MKPTNEKLAADLLEAGKREFLAHGFQGASLRNIAGALNVTTGAIYRYYADKEALFDALVEVPAKKLEERYRKAQQGFAALPVREQLSGLPELSRNGQNWIFDYIYDHFDAFRLISCCSAGTTYEHYIDVLVEIETNSGRVLLDRMEEEGLPVRRIDDDLIHILADALFSGIFETVRHSMPRDRAARYFDSLREFYATGWFRLLGISQR